MLTNKQTLLLCGLMAAGILITGILDILDNFIVLTIHTIVFLAIIINVFFWKHTPEEEHQEEDIE